MTHILKELSKRNMGIPHIALFIEGKWHKRSPKDDFGAFRGGGDFWRVTYLTKGGFRKRLGKLFFLIENDHKHLLIKYMMIPF